MVIAMPYYQSARIIKAEGLRIQAEGSLHGQRGGRGRLLRRRAIGLGVNCVNDQIAFFLFMLFLGSSRFSHGFRRSVSI